VGVETLEDKLEEKRKYTRFVTILKCGVICFDVIVMAAGMHSGRILPLLTLRINRGFVVSKFGEMKPVLDRSCLKHAHV
jgi:hypothetical protein